VRKTQKRDFEMEKGKGKDESELGD